MGDDDGLKKDGLKKDDDGLKRMMMVWKKDCGDDRDDGEKKRGGDGCGFVRASVW